MMVAMSGAAVLAAGLAGCGGGDDAGSSEASAGQAARAVAAEFWDALNDDDGPRACAQIEPKARAEFDALAKRTFIKAGCNGAILYSRNGELGAVKITNTAVTGGTVRVDGTDAQGAPVKVTLVEVDGEWKINSGFEI